MLQLYQHLQMLLSALLLVLGGWLGSDAIVGASGRLHLERFIPMAVCPPNPEAERQLEQEIDRTIRMIMRDFKLTALEMGALLGIKPTSMWRILHGKQRDLLLARTAEFFGESGAAGSAADCRTGRTSQTGRTNRESEAEEE